MENKNVTEPIIEVNVEEKPKKKAIKTATVNAPFGLNLRKDPSMDGDVIEVIENETVLKVIDSVDSEWARVSTSNDTVGYVKKEFLKK